MDAKTERRIEREVGETIARVEQTPGCDNCDILEVVHFGDGMLATVHDGVVTRRYLLGMRDVERLRGLGNGFADLIDRLIKEAE